MDREDEQSGRMEQIHRDLQTAYCQFTLKCQELRNSVQLSRPAHSEEESIEDPRRTKPDLVHQIE